MKEQSSSDNSPLLDRSTVITIVVIFLVGLGATILIFNTEPTAQREAATKRTAMLVDVALVQAGDFRPRIVAMGNVTPAQHIVLQSRVAGEVIRLSEDFVPGRLVEQNEQLLQLDDADYRNILQQRQSELEQATAALDIEMGEQAAAEAEYKRLNRQLTPMQQSLVLRDPQLAMAQAEVTAAKAALTQAQLDVERTQIKAPFTAQVLNRQVNIGSHVAVGDPLAELIGVASYWVEANIPTAQLRWLVDTRAKDIGDTAVQIRDRHAWAPGEYRTGNLHSVIAELDAQSRMARILIEVEDPLALTETHKGLPRLIAGAFVECELQAKVLQNVVRISREYLRKNDTVWVMQDGKLDIREPEIVFRDAEYVYISAGLQGGEKIVVSNLSNVIEGAELRVESDAGASP